MRVQVLGCSGGELPGHRTTSFLVDGVLALDAGALTASLPLSQLLQIEDVVLTHAHLDHVKDVASLADLLVGQRTRPVRVHASTECAQTLRENLFNDRLWPDFTRLPSAQCPAIAIAPFDPGVVIHTVRHTLQTVLVDHTVETVGIVVSDGEVSFAISGDTGPTVAFWRTVKGARAMRAVLVETSFPNRLQHLADVSGHLTPAGLASELSKLDAPEVPVLLYHLKPAFEEEILSEVAAMNLARVRVLEAGEVLEF